MDTPAPIAFPPPAPPASSHEAAPHQRPPALAYPRGRAKHRADILRGVDRFVIGLTIACAASLTFGAHGVPSSSVRELEPIVIYASAD